MARIEAVCRRTVNRPSATIEVGDLKLDLTTRRAIRGQTEFELTPTEFSLLEYLMRFAGKVVTRKMLCEHLLGIGLGRHDERHRRPHQSACAGKLDRGFDQSVDPDGARTRVCASPSLEKCSARCTSGSRCGTPRPCCSWSWRRCWACTGRCSALLQETDQLLSEDAREMSLVVNEFLPDVEQIEHALKRKASTHAHRGLFVELLDGRASKSIWQSESTPESMLAGQTCGSKAASLRRFRPAVLQQELARPVAARGIRMAPRLSRLVADVDKLTKLMLVVSAIVLLVSPFGGTGWPDCTRRRWRDHRHHGPAAPGKLDERLQLRNRDELDRLSLTVNGLLDRIAAYLEQNRQFTANAAARVAFAAGGHSELAGSGARRRAAHQRSTKNCSAKRWKPAAACTTWSTSSCNWPKATPAGSRSAPMPCNWTR